MSGSESKETVVFSYFPSGVLFVPGALTFCSCLKHSVMSYWCVVLHDGVVQLLSLGSAAS